MTVEGQFEGRLALQQRVLPSYRVAFFDLLASRSTDGLSLYAGKPRSNEAIQTADTLNEAQFWPARNVHILGGPLYFCLQRDIMEWIQDWDPHALIMEANPRYLSSRRAVDWMHSKGRPVIGWGLGIGLPKDVFELLPVLRTREFCLWVHLCSHVLKVGPFRPVTDNP